MNKELISNKIYKGETENKKDKPKRKRRKQYTKVFIKQQ